MGGYYTYLISSLPMLQFGATPPISSTAFFQMCRGIISKKDIAMLKKAVSVNGCYDEKIPLTLRRWRAFDVALRNELVKVRASRKKIDPLKHMRCDGYTDPSIAQLALHAYRTPPPLEAEQVLDKARWNMLDELSAGHYFDIDFLMVYGIKLSILERWGTINSADASAELDEALA